MRSWRAIARDLDDTMSAMAATAAWRSDQPRQQQRPAMFTRDIAIQRHFFGIVASAAASYLVERRYGCRQIVDRMNLVWRAMAVRATSTACVRAAIDCPLRPTVTTNATLRVCQRLEISRFVFGGDIRMAVIASQIRMWRRCENDIAMAARTVDVLCRPGSTQKKKYDPDKNSRGTVKPTQSVHLPVPKEHGKTL